MKKNEKFILLVAIFFAILTTLFITYKKKQLVKQNRELKDLVERNPSTLSVYEDIISLGLILQGEEIVV
ncbi:MAG: hypothetical protein M0R50_11870 [Candidatus Cloacimonetes bacterium]|jgi:hypothetical protein|nr:hypothetical protein [Candidatus Cloacimonadota bacterium]